MNDEIILTFKDVQQITQKSRPTIWRWEKQGLFPKSVKFGPNSVGWLKSSIDGWLADKVGGTIKLIGAAAETEEAKKQLQAKAEEEEQERISEQQEEEEEAEEVVL